MKDNERTVAVIEDGVVVNVIVIDTTKPRAARGGETLVEYEDENPACIGLAYDPENGFEQPKKEEHDDNPDI